MKVTSADIQFLIGCTRREAERIIIDAVGRDNIDEKFKVKSSTEIEVSDIKKRLLSVNESMDGKNPVQNAIDLLQQHGLSYSLKRQVFEDMKCLYYCDLKGRYRTLKKILPKEQIDSLRSALKVRRSDFVTSGGKFPKGLKALITNN
ncbi:hypothetical protein [uncultured Parabacteroides sp.]|jgi:hypothetical protein|uniref:hypothetical protein n=1 Tax=uncultured Parabacteroides sp. TaxID=512312 RepID=UPI0025EC2C83|nr:hypothetical protein [uncultured Parabacteroides sp.]